MDASASRPKVGELSVRQARELIGVAAGADAAQVARAYPPRSTGVRSGHGWQSEGRARPPAGSGSMNQVHPAHGV